ncbi:MAG: hypothetical protein LAQ30_24350 [Acidobacteriia bacterium]|nr:hypothetical protein [Terriglobia bacterium]
MFTWICPQCGREVPPAYTDCPDCTAKAAGEQAPVPAEQAPPAAPPPDLTPRGGFGSAGKIETPVAPPPAYVPPAEKPVYAPPPARRRAAGPGLPTWLMAIVFALAFLGLGAGIYWLVGAARGHGQAAPSASVESPAAKPGAVVSPYQKFIEVSPAMSPSGAAPASRRRMRRALSLSPPTSSPTNPRTCRRRSTPN